MTVNEIEVFEFLKAKSRIKNLDINDLQSLLTNASKGKTFKNYTIKMLNKGSSILIHDSLTNNNTLLSCVCDICKDYPKNCSQIRKQLGLDSMSNNCAECYVKHIERINKGEI
jgi:hypothetical protein